MNRCSFFIPGKALFGGFPTQEEVEYLESIGVRCFIDLTNTDEDKTLTYNTKYKYIKYPIVDRKTPDHWKSFAQLIIEICTDIHNLPDASKVYIHCRGGHGRSGVLVACILCYYFSINPEEALHRTNHYHSQRPEMRDKWRKLGSPQGKRQKEFVHKFFRELKYTFPETDYFSIGFDNSSAHPVTIPNIGTFPNAQLAFQSFRKYNNPEYIKKLLQGQFCPEYVIKSDDWEENKLTYMYTVLEYKFRQHNIIRENLMNTGLRPLIRVSTDPYWGNGPNGQGKNWHGKILAKLRTNFLIEDFKRHFKGEESNSVEERSV